MSKTKTSRRQRWRMDMQGWLIEQVVPPSDPWTMLDLGTEYGHSAAAVRAKWPRARITGVEIHEPTLEECRRLRGDVYEDIVQADAIDYIERCEPADVVLAAEIIEHVTPEQGIRLLRALKIKARRLAIVTTPIGFQPHHALDGNPHQEHVSGWYPQDFEALGFTTFVQMPYGYGLGVYFYDRTELL